MNKPNQPKLYGVRGTDWRYENIYGECGACNRPIVLNRATDLQNALPAVGRRTNCPKCGEALRLYGDTGDYGIDLLLDELLFLKHERRYMYCALVLAQAVEMTLWLCAQRVLVIDPARGIGDEATAALWAAFYTRFRTATFEPLKNLVTNLAIQNIRPTEPSIAMQWLKQSGKLMRRSSADGLKPQHISQELREALESLHALSISALRNDVVHKFGRRPTAAEIEAHEPRVREATRKLLRAHGYVGNLISVPVKFDDD
jgi:hypothetical protein